MHTPTEWSIAELARYAGVTSRTLRHYHQVGLLRPCRTSVSGLRFYDEHAVVRLQQILLLRRLGMPLAQIRQVLDDDTDQVSALRAHVEALHAERDAIDRKLRAVEQTIAALMEGVPVNAKEALDGFNEQYKDEVIERWGREAYDNSDRWWNAKSADEQQAWADHAAQLSADWTAAWERGEDPAGAAGQDLARRHVEWLGSVPGLAEGDNPDTPNVIRGLGDMYVADPRFAVNYGGQDGAAFVRDALHIYVEANLESK